MRYYRAEHEATYRRLEREGMTQWSDLFESGRTFEDFPNRAFLERVLPDLGPPTGAGADVWEYGCGTGPVACFLAARGFRVRATDLVPRAVALARRFARERGLHVDFGVQDVCALADEPAGQTYDLVVDSYCLQSIVTDADRERVFAAVRARLRPTGHYLVSTAMYDARRTYGADERYDPATGCCYQAASGQSPDQPSGQPTGDGVRFDGTWYRPHRRHLTPAALRAELAAAGFEVLSQDGELGGDVVCRPARRPGRHRPS